MRLLIIYLLSSVVLFSCKQKQTLADKQKEIETGNLVAGNQYSAEEIGWAITIPEGWPVMTREQNHELNSKGKELLEKSIDAKIDDSGMKQLINLKIL